MNLSDFNYEFDETLIAQHPNPARDKSRLMVLDRAEKRHEHRIFTDIIEYFRPGDLLVLNDTKVFPARLCGKRNDTEGKVEILLIREEDHDRSWETLARGNLRPGVIISFDYSVSGEVMDSLGKGRFLVRFSHGSDILTSKVGKVPLPPYIKRREEKEDRERYQTVWARSTGSIAAPTAGLHFTDRLLKEIDLSGVDIRFLTLHVGPGTFQPIRTDRIEDHKMEAEYYNISQETAIAIKKVKEEGGRVIAVGTTTARAIETIFSPDLSIAGLKGHTGLFIYPGYRFKMVDCLITNFHLPKSTLLLLVSAFAGRDLIMSAYKEAVRLGYRFYSFGDAMLIL